MKRFSKTQWTIFLVAGYLLCQIIADVTAVKMTGPILGQFVPAAVFIYAVTFTWRDLVHKQIGKRATVTLVWAAAVVNVLMAAYFMFAVWLPSAPFWPGQEAFAATLGVVPRIVGASIAGELAAQLLDTEGFERLKRLPQWARVLGSNAISVPIDSIVFVGIAFYGTMPMDALLGVMLGQIIIKAIITVVSIPLIYLVPSRPLYGYPEGTITRANRKERRGA